MQIFPLESLSKHTSFRIGGPARFFVEVGSVSELQEAIVAAQKDSLPYVVLGEGSNVLASDKGFDGYVIRLLILGVEFGPEGRVVAGAGEHWDDLVAQAVAKNLSGIENLSFIPGSAGAAPVQNIGAYGAEIKNVLEWVEVFDPETGEVRKISNTECRFNYRESLFKSPEGQKLIIIRVALKLIPNGTPNISYKDLSTYFSGKTEQPTLAEVREAVIHIRTEKLPDIAKVGTAGSFFKNPIITEAKYADLSKKLPGLPSFPAGEGLKKIPLAWVLDKICKLNGFKIGNVGLYETQPLALTNFGGGTSVEIKNLAEKVFNDVKEKTDIDIEWEVNKIGDI